MIIHIGADHTVPVEDVLMLLDVNTLKRTTRGKAFLEKVAEEGKVEDISEGKPASLVVTTDKCYYTRVVTTTLAARAERYGG